MTLFISATLLFMVQPMVGKMILPHLGGTPAVWNTCMVFFQGVLLVGYSYTHSLSSYQPRTRQIIIHGLLLLTPFLVLPFTLGENWSPPSDHNPIFAVLWLLLGMVGLPFFVVATSAPLLQKWFATTGHVAAKDPYFLYGASNLGSMLALALYPLVIEPSLDLDRQRLTWTIGYGLLVACVLFCGLVVWRAPNLAPLQTADVPVLQPPLPTNRAEENQAGSAAKSLHVTTLKDKALDGWRPKRPWYARHVRQTAEPLDSPRLLLANDQVSWLRRLRWVGLAAVPSSLMLGLTTYLTTDIAAIPFFWVIPLALYLLTFILVFARWPMVWTDTPHFVLLFMQPALVMFVVMKDVASLGRMPTWATFLLHVLMFFSTTLVCHGELAKDRPSPRRLTEFYLWLAVGGVLGGLFNCLVAPLVFWFGIVEYPLAMVLGCLLRPSLLGDLPLIPGDSRGHRTTVLGHALDLLVPLALGVAAYFSIHLGVEFGHRPYFVAFPVVLTLLLMLRPIRFGLSVGCVLIAAWAYDMTIPNRAPTIFADRSFFGLVRVRQDFYQGAYYHTLIHGGIDHGSQILTDNVALRRYPRGYFDPRNGIGQVFQKLSQHTKEGWPDWRMAVSLAGLGAAPGQGVWNQLAGVQSEPSYAIVGLGAGTLACHAKPYQRADFYEIDSLVRRLSEPDARGECIFTYVQDARDRHANLNIIMGDGRLMLRKEPAEHYYHVILLDAFSSDAIPVHLLTLEAIDLYLSKLADGGILAFNTTNRYVDINGVLADIAKERDLVCWQYEDSPVDGYGTDWIILQRRQFGKVPGSFNGGPPLALRFDENRLPDPRQPNLRWRVQPPNGNPPWTDRFSNLLGVLRWR